MLSRQKIALGLLVEVDKPLQQTVFVKLMFLLRQESVLRMEETYYDFVPYMYGPFSFALYQELGSLRQNGYMTQNVNRIDLRDDMLELTNEKMQQLPQPVRCAIRNVAGEYGNLSSNALIKSVYTRYPWYTINSNLVDPEIAAVNRPQNTIKAIYTSGYEGLSIDLFLDRLLRKGIKRIIDVRSNPISRKYGFSKLRLCDIAQKLGIEYSHFPNLGIPSSERTDLSDYASYQALLNWYETAKLPLVCDEVSEVAGIMKQEPSVLVCAESDFRCCHRSRLAKAISCVNGLEVKHL